jgi:hypothetical protein
MWRWVNMMWETFIDAQGFELLKIGSTMNLFFSLLQVWMTCLHLPSPYTFEHVLITFDPSKRNEIVPTIVSNLISKIYYYLRYCIIQFWIRWLYIQYLFPSNKYKSYNSITPIPTWSQLRKILSIKSNNYSNTHMCKNMFMYTFVFKKHV